MEANLKALALFNAVLLQENKEAEWEFIQDYGVVIQPSASYAREDIERFFKNAKLSGEQLNQTFHKSWNVIATSSRFELYLHQMMHYLTTYGTGHSSTFVYAPYEHHDVPQMSVTLTVVRALSKDELIEKSLDMLRSGIALTSDTLDLIFGLLSALKYTFTGDEGVRNKEAMVRIADTYGVYPKNPSEFLRFLIYRSTGDTLVIKNRETIEAIKGSNFNPAMMMQNFGEEKLATIFNRYKPIFLAYKSKCPSVINRISKLSKKLHKPMKPNLVNLVTSEAIHRDSLLEALDNATVFHAAKAIQALNTRIQGQDTFVYRVRNGKSYTKENTVTNMNTLEYNYDTILMYFRNKFDFTGVKAFIPDKVEYALPTSEKMFVGNIPTGTKFYGRKLAAGIYWRDEWGARDLDLSGMGLGKVGWNSSYNSGGLMYSGDLTSARDGAVEYLYANSGELQEPTLVLNNVFSGDNEAGYKIIVGDGDDITRKYMMNPNNVMVDVRTQSVQRQTAIGMLLPATDKKQMSFVLLNFGSGSLNVSRSGGTTQLAKTALVQQWSNPYTFNKLFELCGGTIVTDKKEADIDMSPQALEKDTFTKLLTDSDFVAELRKQKEDLITI